MPKLTAADWAKRALPPRWKPLIEVAWSTRLVSKGQASQENIQGTLDFIRYALEEIKKIGP